jgi:hypothetical protein
MRWASGYKIIHRVKTDSGAFSAVPNDLLKKTDWMGVVVY